MTFSKTRLPLFPRLTLPPLTFLLAVVDISHLSKNLPLAKLSDLTAV